MHSIFLGFLEVGLGCYSTVFTLFDFPWFFHWKKVQVCNCKQNNWDKLHIRQKLEFNIFFLEAKGENKFISQHELVFLTNSFPSVRWCIEYLLPLNWHLSWNSLKTFIFELQIYGLYNTTQGLLVCPPSCHLIFPFNPFIKKIPSTSISKTIYNIWFRKITSWFKKRWSVCQL